MKCAECGSGCGGHPTTRKGKSYVWADVRAFLTNPGEVLERLREQLAEPFDTDELERRREELGRRLATKQAEKDRYVHLYAQGHISEAELEIHLLDLKNQIENLRLPLGSVEAELSEKRTQQGPTEAAHAWLVALRERTAEVEEDTDEAFRARRQLVKFLVQPITVGKKHEEGRIEVRITYRFGPPSPLPAEAGRALSVAGLKNGSRS